MVLRLFRVGVCAFFLLFSTSASAGLIAHWKLDEPEGTEGVDSILDSGPTETHPGTPDFPIDTSPVTLEVEGATENTGTAASFMNGVINVPYDEALNPESFTFCVWVKANSTAGFQSVVTSRYDMGPGVELYGYVLYNDNNGNWAFWTGHGGPAPWHILGGPPVEIDVWHHIAISFDSETATKRILIDGVEVASATDQGYVPNPQQDFHLGAGGDLGTQYYFDGSLDEAALWSRALEDTEVVSVMEDGVTSVSDGLVAYWKLDDPEGSAGEGAIEDSAGDYDGNLPPPPFLPGQPGATENTGTSIAFSNASINVPYSEELNPESFTLTVWANPAMTGGFQSVVTNRYDIGPGQNIQGFIIYNDNNGNWAFWTGDGDPMWPQVIGPPVELNTWQHLAISFDSETMTKTLYVNGEEVASATDQGYVPNSGMDLHIGGGGDMGDQFRFVGLIDDVALFDEALSQEDIQDIMENGIGGEEPPEGPLFMRGDANDDGNRNIADAIFILGYLFGGDAAPACQDAADTNDDGQLNIADAIAVLGHLFGGTGDLPAPFPGCGKDPTDTDTLPKCEYTHCP